MKREVKVVFVSGNISTKTFNEKLGDKNVSKVVCFGEVRNISFGRGL
jgi:hypothetical protein